MLPLVYSAESVLDLGLFSQVLTVVGVISDFIGWVNVLFFLKMLGFVVGFSLKMSTLLNKGSL